MEWIDIKEKRPDFKKAVAVATSDLNQSWLNRIFKVSGKYNVMTARLERIESTEKGDRLVFRTPEKTLYGVKFWMELPEIN